LIHEGDVIDVGAAARLLGLHEESLRRMARHGQIPAFKLGRVWRFNRSTLHQWAEGQQRTGGHGRVLVVDDEESSLKLMGLVVQKAGFKAVRANSGAKALDIMRQRLPDVILLDLKMPGMDGPAILKQIRQTYGLVPVVLITGYPDSDLVARALEDGPVTLLAKPVKAQQLASTVRMALDGAHGISMGPDAQ
jgi:excisionase family DNA binding protein